LVLMSVMTNSQTGIVSRLRKRLPQGETLPEDIWHRRHRGFVAFLWLQTAGLIAFGIYRGFDPVHSLLEGGTVGLLALVASIRALGRTERAIAATLGLLSASAILVHLSGGVIEAHFHFFVMVTLITLYQLWAPFLISIAYVVVHHGVMGTLDPGSVYNHPAAIDHPFKWALIHGIFILGATIAGLIVWKRNEEYLLLERRRQQIEGDRRRKQALEMNDSIVQGLAVAAMAREIGDHQKAHAAVEDTLSEARAIVTTLIQEFEESGPLAPGDLVLDTDA
jgi:hypothetical protein